MFGRTLGEIQDEFRDESEKASEVCFDSDPNSTHSETFTMDDNECDF